MVAFSRIERLVIGASRWLCGFVVALTTAAAGAAECPQITTWSNQDMSYFPVERVSRVDHANTPGSFYFDLDNVQEKTLLVTYFSLVATPSKTVDQRFANAVGVWLTSFRSPADALAMFQREVLTFNRINPVRWGYRVLNIEGQHMIYADDTPGDQQIHYLAPWHNTIIQLTLKSASRDEDLSSVGVAQLADRILQAHALVDRRCNVNNPPSITLLNAGPGVPGSEFQSVMANGEIWVRAYDADGVGDLDWGSFRLFVAGIDKTAHALQVLNRLSVRYTENLPNEAIYQLVLNRYRLMGDHNFFNIAWNGEWPVDLKICDRKGACSTSSYKLNFGPYVYVSAIEDLRCSSNGTDHRIRLKVSFGNNGYSTQANVYVVLGPASKPWQSWSGGFSSLSLIEPVDQGVVQWFGDTYGVLPVFLSAPVDLPTAWTVPDHDQLSLEISASANVRSAQPVALGAGSYTLVTGAVDLQQGTSSIETRATALCASK